MVLHHHRFKDQEIGRNKTGNIRGALKICRHPFCRRSFATWDVLLPSKKLAVKLAESNVSTKHFWLQLEYKGTRGIKVTVCSILVQLNGDVLTVHMIAYGSVEEVMTVLSSWTSALIGRASWPSYTYWPIRTSRWWWSWKVGGYSAGPANSKVIYQEPAHRSQPSTSTTLIQKNHLSDHQSCPGTGGPPKQTGKRVDPGD